MPDKRTFIAIDISDAARDVCRRHIAGLDQNFKDVRVGWERHEKLHITMKFLGATSERILAKLDDGLTEVAREHEAFTLRMSRPGVFPTRSRPRILWLGVEDVRNATASLHRKADDICERLGFKKENRQFRPHVSIGRIRDTTGSLALANAHLESVIEPIEFKVGELVLYESKLQRTGSVYRALATYRLGDEG